MKKRLLSVLLVLCILCPALRASALEYPVLSHNPVGGMTYCDGYAVTFREGTTLGYTNVYLDEDSNTPLKINFGPDPTPAGFNMSAVNVFAGHDTGDDASLSLTMEGGNVGSLEGPNRGGVSGDVTITALGGDTGDIYGTRTPKGVGGTVTITLGGTVQTGTVSVAWLSATYPAGGGHVRVKDAPQVGSATKGIMINGGTDNYDLGVDAVEIAGPLTGEPGSISLYLPKGYAGGVLVTGAQPGDVDKFRLVGPGKGDLALVYENGNLTTGPSHTVTFYDGSVPYTDPAPQNVPDRGKVTAPPKPEKAGVYFVKWRTADGADFDFNTPITADTALYAVWRDPIHPVSVRVNQPDITLPVGGTLRVAPIIEPTNADDKSVTWVSDRPDIATVADDGLVTAVSAGTAILTVTTRDGGLSNTGTVTVRKQSQTPPQNLRGVQPGSAVAADGRILGLDPSRSYEYCPSGSSSYLAVPPESREIAGLAPGIYQVRLAETAQYYSSGPSTVTVPAYSETFVPVYALTGGPSAVKAGESVYLSASVEPLEATRKDLTWSLKDPGDTLAQIEADVFTATYNGTAVVTATVPGGLGDSRDFTQDFTITVTGGRLPPATGITVTPSTATLYTNADPRSIALTASVQPSGAYQQITWSSDNEGVATVDTNGTVTAVSSGTAVITATCVDGLTASSTITVTTSGGGGGGGGSSTPPAAGETVNPDGSKTTTVTDQKTGAVTETTKYPDGSTTVLETQKDGTATLNATIPAKAVKDGEPLVIKTPAATLVLPAETLSTLSGGKPVEVRLSVTPSDAPGALAGITLSAKAGTQTLELVTLHIPLSGLLIPESLTPLSGGDGAPAFPTVTMPGTVAKSGDAFLPTSYVSGDVFTVALSGDASITIVDNGKSFSDVPEDSWAYNAVAFAAARELFSGTGDGRFSPSTGMDRAMLWTVLARLDGQDLSGGESWYAKAQGWAVAQGISDGAAPGGGITREQLAALLYRYSGSPAQEQEELSFPDAGQVSSWAADSMAWAVREGILSGKDGGLLDPQGAASRAEVAVVLQRYLLSQTVWIK